MNLEELEAVIRRTLTRVVVAALQGRDDSAILNNATDTILGAAIAFAAGDSDLVTQLRRDVLHTAAAPAAKDQH